MPSPSITFKNEHGCQSRGLAIHSDLVANRRHRCLHITLQTLQISLNIFYARHNLKITGIIRPFNMECFNKAAHISQFLKYIAHYVTESMGITAILCILFFKNHVFTSGKDSLDRLIFLIVLLSSIILTFAYLGEPVYNSEIASVNK